MIFLPGTVIMMTKLSPVYVPSSACRLHARPGAWGIEGKLRNLLSKRKPVTQSLPSPVVSLVTQDTPGQVKFAGATLCMRLGACSATSPAECRERQTAFGIGAARGGGQSLFRAKSYQGQGDGRGAPRSPRTSYLSSSAPKV